MHGVGFGSGLGVRGREGCKISLLRLGLRTAWIRDHCTLRLVLELLWYSCRFYIIYMAQTK